jgi:hypothetical protein
MTKRIQLIAFAAYIARLLPIGLVLFLARQLRRQWNAVSRCHQTRTGIGHIGLSMGENAGTKANPCFRSHCCSGPRRDQHNRIPMEDDL